VDYPPLDELLDEELLLDDELESSPSSSSSSPDELEEEDEDEVLLLGEEPLPLDELEDGLLELESLEEEDELGLLAVPPAAAALEPSSTEVGLPPPHAARATPARAAPPESRIRKSRRSALSGPPGASATDSRVLSDIRQTTPFIEESAFRRMEQVRCRPARGTGSATARRLAHPRATSSILPWKCSTTRE
jgi:hypothetical protein